MTRHAVPGGYGGGFILNRLSRGNLLSEFQHGHRREWGTDLAKQNTIHPLAREREGQETKGRKGGTSESKGYEAMETYSTLSFKKGKGRTQEEGT